MSEQALQRLQGRGTLDDANVLRDDDPPLLRFERTTLENRHKTIETGRYGYKDAILVYVRAYGDIKTEVPYVAWTTVLVPTVEQVMVEKQVPVIIERVRPDGTTFEEEEFRQKTVYEDRETFAEEEKYPWFEQLDDRLRNGRISQSYRDYCRNMFEQWRQKGEVPLDGKPVAEWNMISGAQQATLIDLGLNTIERVAQMSEDAMTEVGMGAREIKRKAEAWLEADVDNELSSAKIVSLEAALDRESEERQGLQAKLAELEKMLEAQTSPD